MFFVASRGPFVPWEMHCIFVTINFHTLLVTVILVGVISITTRIDRPHIPFGLSFDHPFRQYLARAARLRDPKCEYTSLKRIWHTRHRPDQRQTIGCVWNWTVDYSANARGAQ